MDLEKMAMQGPLEKGGISRRKFLRGSGVAVATAIAGCGRNEENTTTFRDAPTETPTPTPTPTPEFPDSGTLHIQLADEPWPDDYFNGDVDLTLGRKNDPLTIQELREQQHYNQIYRILEGDPDPEIEILREFPQKLTDEEWVREKLIEPMPDVYIEPDAENPFNPEIYTSDQNLNDRLEESNYGRLWNMVAHIALGGPSSNNDYIKTAALTAAEYETAGRETITFNVKNNNAVHGLGFALTGLTYNDEELEQQETWGIETDPLEDQLIWDLDETESYPNRDYQQIMIETPEGSYRGWKRLGITRGEEENLTINWHKQKEWQDFLRDPDEQKGMKYLDSACIAGYLNRHVYEKESLRELRGATLDVYPDGIDYRLA